MVTTLKTCGIILVLTLDSSVNQLVDTLRKNMVVNLNRYTKKKIPKYKIKQCIWVLIMYIKY
jgi:S-ribosylhomocysteine lyase LuxS involved in autoinducer biosynthesis